MKNNIFTAAIITFLLLLNINVFAAEYEIRDLGDWEPVDINNNAQIVGRENYQGVLKPVLWDQGIETVISDSQGLAMAINESGQVVGHIGTPHTDNVKAFLWQNNSLTYLNIEGIEEGCYASDINESGKIAGGQNGTVGYWEDGNFAVVDESYSIVAPPTSTTITYWVSAINNTEDIVGNRLASSINGGGWAGGCYWDYDQSLEILSSQTKDINDNKEIVGLNTIRLSDGEEISIDLDSNSINNSDIIVGSSNGHASIYEAGIIKDINDLIPQNSGWVLTLARAINDLGQIVCYGTLNGVNKVCLLTPVANYDLYDTGTEFPVNYENYGTFSNQGTGTYNYELNNPVGLSAAVGEGIYPNSESVLLDPRYQEYLSSGKLDGDVWNFINSADPWADFFKWATAINVQLGEKLFYTALALENCGQYQHAIKAYKALIVHFPYTQAYNPFENIYWYPGIRAIDAISRLTTEHPEIGYELINAKITIENGYDSDISDDIFTASAGAFTEYTLQDRIDRSVEKVIATDLEVRGTGRVQVIKRSDDSWQMRVDNKPFKIKGITYSPTKVGMVADDQTAWQWLDTNDNGLIDAAEEAWVDLNKNNLQDADEPKIGDFQLLKDMGCNSIRFFHYAGADNKTYQSDEFNKILLRQMYARYGIMVMMADFFGGYTIGSGASWEEGTDYTNPEHRAAIKEVVRQMVLDHKDEPYVLMWVLGNENNMASEYNGINATRTNAADEPQAYAEFLNEVALMIHEIDPDHPVAVGNLNLGLVEYYAQYAPELDIIATNHYTDRFGVGVSYLREAQEKIDRPLIISEYGADAYHQDQGINELEQKQHHFGGWKAIAYNGSTTPGEGNILGGIIFEWTDEWWKAQSEYDSPWIQEIAPQFYWGIMPDHFAHEEWFGICSQGNGTQSPFLRQLRSAYDLYKQLWTPSAVFDQDTGFVTLSWDGYPGLTYTVECSEDNINWRAVSSDIKASLYGRTVWIDNGTQTGGRPITSRRYYRVSINGTSSDVYVLNVFSGYNQVPVANDQSIELNKNETIAFSLTASDDDGDDLIYTILTQPQYGTLSGTFPDLIYTPNSDYFGVDEFSYIASDGIDTSEIAYVNISVLYQGAAGIAEFVKRDTTTQGNWIGAYGVDGYNVIGDSVNYPSNAQVSNSGSAQWVWNSSTSEVRALEKAAGTDRIAGCWYGFSSFDINVSITDGQTQQVGIYCLDWSSTARRQTVQILDAGNQAVLDTQVINTSFDDGIYLVWNISGSVIIRLIKTSGDNAVISGVFFGGPGIAGVAPSIITEPEGVTIIEGQSAVFNVTANGSDPLTYQWYRDDIIIDGATASSYTTPAAVLADNGLSFKVTITNDYGTITSNEAVLNVDPAGNAAAVFINSDIATQGNWIGQYGADGYNVIGDTVNYPSYAQVSRSNSGQWVWNSATTNASALEKVLGSDRIAGCWYGSPSQDIQVNITDGQTHQMAIYCLDWESSARRQRVEVLDAVSKAVLDIQELNNAFTNGVYLAWNISGSVIIRITQTGTDNTVVSGIFFGGNIAGIAPSITAQPEAMTVIEGQTVTFNVTASGSNPLTYQWYRDDVLIDGATASSHTIASAALSDDGASFKVSVSNDYGLITSSVAVLSVNSAGNAAAVFVNSDITTQGNWIGTYGAEGYNVIGDSVNYPSYAQISNSGSVQWVWNSATSEVRALEKADGSGRIAGCWYGSDSFDINVNITDGQTHQVAIYCLDWDSTVRRQTVEVVNADSGAVLDTRSLNTSFNGGAYLVWDISGSVIIRVNKTSGDNAIINGLFFGESGGVIGVAPSIISQPEDITIFEGQAASFNVTANGSDPMTYQWYKDDVLIDGATAASYTTPVRSLSDNGCLYKVTVINDYSSVTSQDALLTVNQIASSSASFIRRDTTRKGSWKQNDWYLPSGYGHEGYNIIGDSFSYPAYAQVSTNGYAQWIWDSSTTDESALEKASGEDRIAGCWYGASSFDIQVNITDRIMRQVGLYFLDWQSSIRRQRIEVLDASSGQLLDSRDIDEDFTEGVYLFWNISGSVIFRITATGTDNAVVSGLFFDNEWDNESYLTPAEAKHIRGCQYLDGDNPVGYGAINDVPGDPTWVVPREMGLAILGLAKAGDKVQDNLSLLSARMAAYYLVRMQDTAANDFEVMSPGIRLYDGGWFNQYGYETAGDIGNTSAPYNTEALSKSPTQTAEVMLGFYALGFDDADAARKESMRLAAEFLITLQGADGLINGGLELYEVSTGSGVYNYRTSDWRWTSDNAFSYQALRAAETWAVQSSDNVSAQRFHNAANAVLDGINTKLYVSDPSDPDYGVWWGVIDGNDIPQFPQGHEWMSYAPQMLDLPATGVGQQIVGEWIHNKFQIKTAGDDFGAVVWNDTWGSERKSPGFSFQAMLVWLDLGQNEYVEDARDWAFNSGLWHTDFGWIDWVESDTAKAGEWERFIDTSFYAIAACTGGYDFNIPATYTAN
ncbi:MAG: immunoglobulin domain-containing protein [Candidatus Omnitrophica bacterium]|nr:immunoglobulin domain-containing protein [Candidatus Omnitrophota bacterium]